MNKPSKWFTATPCIPICSDMHLRLRKPRRRHVPVLVIPLTAECVERIRFKMAEAFNGSYDGHLHHTDIDAMLRAIGVPPKLERSALNVKR